MTDEFTMYDAAYLLGALTPQDRADFENHLAGCHECRRSVNQLAGMPGLLAGVAPEHTGVTPSEDPPLPDTLLPRLLREVQRTRFRRRWTTAAVGAVAAAVLAIALAVGLNDAPAGLPKAPTSVAAQRMTPVSPGLPIHATVQLAAKQWGTELTIWCTYEGFEHLDGPFTYSMVVTDKSGATQQIAWWAAKAGEPIVADATTSIPESQIASVEVRGPSDVPLLVLKR